MRKFFEESSNIVFNLDFFSINLVDVLEDGESKDLLRNAENYFEEGKYTECLIECRKAIYVEFESDYNVKRFESGGLNMGFLGHFSSAPHFARSKEYIESHVKDPFDYIVLDHSRLDSELMKLGIDHGGWWNIWRLTPSVYRHESDDPWMVKEEPESHEGDGMRERASYVLETAVEAVRKKQAWKRSLRWARKNTTWYVEPSEGAKIYKKASRDSEVLFTVPKSVKKLDVSYGTPSLDGSENFWYVFHMGEGFNVGGIISGYLSEDDTVE